MYVLLNSSSILGASENRVLPPPHTDLTPTLLENGLGRHGRHELEAKAQIKLGSRRFAIGVVTRPIWTFCEKVG